MTRPSLPRFLCFLLALGLACLALATPYTRYGADVGGFEASAVYSGPLLDKKVPLLALQSLVAQPGFVSTLGSPVEIRGVEGQSAMLQLTTRDPSENVARLAQKRAAELLSRELSLLAQSELTETLIYIEGLERELLDKQLNPTDTGPSPLEVEAARLSGSDTARVLLLQKEILQLEDFFKGSPLTAELRARMDRRSLSALELRMDSAQRELDRLSVLWRDESKVLVDQRKLLQQAQSALSEAEHGLAGVLLESHRLELKDLESKNHSLVKQNQRAQAAVEKEPVKPPLGAGVWLKEKAQTLKIERDSLKDRATLEQLGEITVQPLAPSGYWIRVALWCGAVVLLLAALSTSAQTPEDTGSTLEAGSSWARGLSPPANPRPETFRADGESFFAQLHSRFESAMGCFPKRVLILGAAGQVQNRCSVSLGIAVCLADSGQPVRLVDFDLEQKSLSRQLSTELNVPGVTELLSGRGPVEEFFASIPRHNIQFAPAGLQDVITPPVLSDTVRQLLAPPKGGVCLVDASFFSPVHLLVSSIDAVLCVTNANQVWSPHEKKVLLGIREARIPIWGICKERAHFFPFI